MQLHRLIGLLLALAAPVIFAADNSVTVRNAEELSKAVTAANAAGGSRTIRLADGTYDLANTLQINAPYISLVGASNNPLKVIVQGDAMAADAKVGNVIRVAASGFLLSGITVQKAGNHLIQIAGESDADGAIIRDCILRDSWEQMVKVSVDPQEPGVSADHGLIENCRFEYTAGIGPQYYIGGVDAHGSQQWTIRGNTFINIKSPEERVAEHAVHFWNGSADNVVEQNIIEDCDRGVGFGLGDAGNQGGVIRHNIIHASVRRAGPAADAGIILESSPNTRVYNNTVFLEHNYPNAIEYRFPATTGVQIYNNLTNRPIRSRDGGEATVQSNVLVSPTRVTNLEATNRL